MRRTLLPLLAAAFVLSGCSAVDGVTDRFAQTEDLGPPVVTMGVLAPLSGGQTRAGTAVVDALEQAVTDAGGVPGWEIAVTALDVTAESVDDDLETLGRDDTAVAVVGGFSAEDVRTYVPRLDDDGFTVVSPADTDPRHTRGSNPASPIRPWSGYLTVAVEPTPEATALADHLVRAAGVSSVLVVHDADNASTTQAQAVAEGVTQRGVTDVTTLEWAGSSREEVTSAIAGLGAGGALVLAVDAATAQALAGEASPDVTVGLAAVTPALDEQQAAALEGAVAPLPGLDPRRGSDELAARYAETGNDATVGPHGPATYDAGRMLVDALGRCLPDPQQSRSPSRSACRAEVSGIAWDGITGRIQLDEYGARLGLLPAVATLQDGEWA